MLDPGSLSRDRKAFDSIVAIAKSGQYSHCEARRNVRLTRSLMVLEPTLRTMWQSSSRMKIVTRSAIVKLKVFDCNQMLSVNVFGREHTFVAFSSKSAKDLRECQA